MRTPIDPRPCRTIEEAAADLARVQRPGWVNAHRVYQDHQLEIARLEREAAQAAHAAFPLALIERAA